MARVGGTGPPLLVADPPLVGRDAERATQRRAIDGAATGAGRGILITGEAGIGKSALLAAACAQAADAGFLVLSGRGHEVERGLAYAPLVDAFGRDLGRLGPRRAAAVSTRPRRHRRRSAAPRCPG
jgi:predicted ATPase